MIIDVHAHLDFDEYKKDIDKVIKKNVEENVKAVICNGVNPKANRRILSLSKKYYLLKSALGYYPSECDQITRQEFNKELEFIKKNKDNIIAVGEVGLDKKYVHNFEKQKEFFEEFIDLSSEINKPIIVHSRKAELEAIDILERKKANKVVMHCFSGKKKLVKRIIENKWFLSIPANVVRNQQFQENVNICPLKQLLTETDSPFLSHNPKVSRNEPRFIANSLKKIAEIKCLDVKELENIIFANYQRLFL